MRTDKKVITYTDLAKLRQRATAAHQKIVLTMGSFDVLHLGHAIHFEYCKKQGDILVIGVGNDWTISFHKGPNRPINNQRIRARLVACLGAVDYAVISEEFTPNDIVDMAKLLQPDVFVLPASDSQQAVRRAQLEAQGAKVIVCRRTPPMRLKGGISTSQIIKRLEEGTP